MKVFEYGDEAGIPLVLFSGTPQKGDAFAGLDMLAKETRIRLICPTRPWYDGSAVAPSFDAVTAPLLDYLQQRRISWMHVMGVSGGGPFAFQLAKIAPGKVATCTLLASIGMPEVVAQYATSLPARALFEAFRPRDYGAWMETAGRWGLTAEMGHGAWGDLVVYFDELSHMDLALATPTIVHQSASDPVAPLQGLEAMLAGCRSVSWRIGERAGQVAAPCDPAGQPANELFTAIFKSIASGRAI